MREDRDTNVAPAPGDVAACLDAGERQRKIATLKDEMRLHARSADWRAVLATQEELIRLDSGTKDVEHLVEQARRHLVGLERMEEERRKARGTRIVGYGVVGGHWPKPLKETLVEMAKSQRQSLASSFGVFANDLRRDEVPQWVIHAAPAGGFLMTLAVVVTDQRILWSRFRSRMSSELGERRTLDLSSVLNVEASRRFKLGRLRIIHGNGVETFQCISPACHAHAVASFISSSTPRDRDRVER